MFAVIPGIAGDAVFDQSMMVLSQERLLESGTALRKPVQCHHVGKVGGTYARVGALPVHKAHRIVLHVVRIEEVPFQRCVSPCMSVRFFSDLKR